MQLYSGIISGTVGGCLEIDTYNQFNSVSCNFYGDTPLLHPPVTMSQFVNASREIGENLNASSAVPVTVHLLPISLLTSDGKRVVQEIDTGLYAQVKCVRLTFRNMFDHFKYKHQDFRKSMRWNRPRRKPGLIRVH